MKTIFLAPVSITKIRARIFVAIARGRLEERGIERINVATGCILSTLEWTKYTSATVSRISVLPD